MSRKSETNLQLSLPRSEKRILKRSFQQWWTVKFVNCALVLYFKQVTFFAIFASNLKLKKGPEIKVSARSFEAQNVVNIFSKEIIILKRTNFINENYFLQCLEPILLVLKNQQN